MTPQLLLLPQCRRALSRSPVALFFFCIPMEAFLFPTSCAGGSARRAKRRREGGERFLFFFATVEKNRRELHFFRSFPVFFACRRPFAPPLLIPSFKFRNVFDVRDYRAKELSRIMGHWSWREKFAKTRVGFLPFFRFYVIALLLTTPT